MLTISIDTARGFLVNHHGLDKKLDNTPHNIMTLFDTIGSIQYDPLNVVGRNPDLVLQARFHNYSSDSLHSLLYEKRSLIDGWDKMMSIYPTYNWSYFRRIREQHGQGTINTLAYRKSLKALDLTEELIHLMAANGPIQSSKLPGASAHKGPWGHKKLNSAALDYLYAKGDICIYDKINSQKLYNLTVNVIPDTYLQAEDPFETEDDFIEWYLLRRIKIMGLAWNKSGGTWLGYYIQKKADRTPIIKKLLKNKEISQVQVKGIKEIFYVSNDYIDMLKKDTMSFKPFVRFIAPLDNFMWDRDMIEALFDFKYRWEVYTPIVKRQYGYYVLPILYNNRLIGRIEFDYYRGEGKPVIKNIWYEENFTPDDEFRNSFDIELEEFSNYLKRSYNTQQ